MQDPFSQNGDGIEHRHGEFARAAPGGSGSSAQRPVGAGTGPDQGSDGQGQDRQPQPMMAVGWRFWWWEELQFQVASRR